jgi:hypothetical protein
MKFITFKNKQLTFVFALGVLLSFTSCGSFQYSGIYADGIYADTPAVEQNNTAVNDASNSSNYYTNYFKEKSLQIEEDNSVFTDVDSYEGAYADGSENTNNYAGWGENNSKEITINVYDNGPFYGNAWGNNWGYNWGNNWNWNWNLGWNNWGFGFWQPNYYNPWFNPYCNFGCYNNYGYYNYGYNRYRGRSYAYINGNRNGRFRNSSLSSRSVLSATTRNRVNTRSSSRATIRTRATSRPTNTRSTTRSRATSRPNNTRATRSNSTSRPNTTTRSNRSSTRSSTPSATRSRSTSRSRSSGSSTRRRNN